MLVYYNNQEVDIDIGSSILDLLSSMEAVEHKAVWLNGEHIPLEEFDKVILKVKDRIKVVRIRGGG